MSAAVDPFAPAELGPVTVRNRFIKSATFEGMGDGRQVSDELVDFHRAVASGGVGTSTVAFASVSMDGRGAPGELVVRPELVPGLARLAAAIDVTGATPAIQIGHAGPVGAAVSRNNGLAPSRVFAPQALRFTTPASEIDLGRVIGEFAQAAALVVEAGFRVVELHFGHGYLVSAFLSPGLNKRRDRWGGSVENRARLARVVAEAVRHRVGDAAAVTAKLNMADGVKGGLWLDDSVATARLLEADGHLDALELTGGSSFQNPMYLFRGDAPIAELAAQFPQPMRLGLQLTGRHFLRTYPFEEAYFGGYARQFRDALSMPLILLGGINRLETAQQAFADGFEFVAMARALLREPDLVGRWSAGETSEGLCVHCNRCMPSIYDGTHCVLVPAGERPGRRR